MRERHDGSWTRSPFRALACLLMAGSMTLGCSRFERPRLPIQPTRGVILISIDTLRADHVSAYGYGKQTTPFLDSLAAQGTLFEHAYSQYPSTLTSHMTVFTGLYPGEHGVYPPDHVLAQQIPTLPEVFKAHGYRTAGFTEGGFMRGKFGFSRGFDEFSDKVQREESDVERTFERGLSFLRTLKPEDRFFLFLHTYVVHAPYEPPAPYDHEFWPGPAPGVGQPTGAELQELNRTRRPIPDEVLHYYESQYDGSIRYGDDVIRHFFHQLQAMGLSRDLTVIIMSDHGEEFREHGEFAHGQIYRETLHVPLIVVYPGSQSGQRVGEPVELVDITPTLYALARIEPPETLSGISLAPALFGRSLGSGHSAYSEVAAGGSRSRIWLDDDGMRQLVVNRSSGRNWQGPISRFDLEPGERSLIMRSYGVPRRVTVAVDGEQLAQLDLGTSWRAVPVRHGPDASRRRIEVRADGCTETREDRHHECVSYAFQNKELRRVELFDMTADPAESHDLSFTREDIVRRYLPPLLQRQFVLRAAASTTTVTKDEAKRLHALGYLN